MIFLLLGQILVSCTKVLIQHIYFNYSYVAILAIDHEYLTAMIMVSGHDHGSHIVSIVMMGCHCPSDITRQLYS